MRSLRAKSAGKVGLKTILLASDAELQILIEALDAKAREEGETDGTKYGSLRVDLLQARYGRMNAA